MTAMTRDSGDPATFVSLVVKFFDLKEGLNTLLPSMN